MTRLVSTITAFLLSLFLSQPLIANNLHSSDQAEVYELGSVKIIDPWLKSQIGGAHKAKLFFEYRNDAQLSERLVSVSSPLARGETRFIVVGSASKQRTLSEAEVINFPGGSSSYELSEIGHYVELSGLQIPILMGKRIPVTLTFKNAGSITIDIAARFHSPKLTRRIKEAAAAGDIEALNALRPLPQ